MDFNQQPLPLEPVVTQATIAPEVLEIIFNQADHLVSTYGIQTYQGHFQVILDLFQVIADYEVSQ